MNAVELAPAAPATPVSPRRLRVVIADDEPPARERLKRLLVAEPDVEVVAECTTGHEARAAIDSLDPDLALLDVCMPALDGMQVAAALPPDRIRPFVIFITAHENYATSAFTVHALDYLLKPCPPARLRQALQRARLLLARERPATERTAPLQRLLVRVGERLLVVPTSELDWVESANNYVVLHTGRTTHVLRESLADLEARLAGSRFMRISRFALVNLQRVREIVATNSGGHQLLLFDGTPLPITRGVREVQARLELA